MVIDQAEGAKGGVTQTKKSPIKTPASAVATRTAADRPPPSQIFAVKERIHAGEATARLAAIVECSEDAIIRKDLDGTVQSWNAGAEKIFGYSAAEMVGQPARQLIPADRLEEEERILSKIAKGETAEHFETIRIRKDGTHLNVSIVVSPIKDATGRVIGASKIARDITEQKRIEQQLRASLREIGDLKAALDEHAIVAITDAQGRITSVNDKFCEISKYSREELLGQDHRIINSGYHPTEFIRDLWTTIAHGKVWHGEIKNRAKDSSFYWVDTTIVPFLNENGKPRQYVAIRADITQRKEIEEQLRASLRELNDFKAALDEHAIVAMTDPQGRITYVNDKFCAISKYSREELLGQDHRIINSGYHPTEFIRDLWTTITHGKVWHGEIKNRAKDGSYYWVDTTIVPFLNDKGKPRQYVAIRADITERKQIEEQLRASLREVGDLKTALDEHAIVAMTDPQGRITYVNDKFCQISKYSRQELLGQDHRIINSGYHPTEFIRDLWTTITHGKVWHGEIKNRAKDGSFYWVDTTIVPFLNEKGKPRQYVAIRADITARKRDEESLRLQASLLDQSYDAILLWELNGPIRFWNRGAAVLYSYTKEEAVGRLSHELLGTSPALLQQARAALAREGKWEGELNHTARDGRQLTIESRMVVVLENDQQLVLEANRDITERKRAEAAVRELNTELEQRVIQRTAELENANKELEAFSYSVSHDLRAPLRAVDGFSQAVLEDFGTQLPEEGRHYLKTIREGAQKMGALIDDLLTFSRLSRLPLNKRSVNTNRIVRETLEELGFPEEGRQIEMRIAELPASLGDSALLKQLWLNLLSNALKYTRRRESTVIEVGCRREDGKGENVFFVRDNGTGFDMRYAGKLFGVFQRLHRVEEFEGTGVGLAIVQRIVHRHGGRIWAEAALDQGATFYFTLEGEPHHE
ncbi:MAG TPA: PAS domain S-box protein [Chthoniobacterales bacterium]|nr:PAS domain S-box protein [Chthoniobacterales bacterium]